MKKLPISVYMIASNEEQRLPVALEAIKDWADEIIIVIDEKCKDNTKKIAESYGAKVSLKNWVGFAAQKCFAEEQCKNDWVFNLDADEEVSKELQQKLQDIFTKEELPDVSGFVIPWITLYPGQLKAPMFAFKDKILRLYNKHKGGIVNEEYRNLDRPELTDGTNPGYINAPVYHRTILSFSHLEEKSTLYSQDQATYNFNKGKKISNFKLFAEYPFKFLKYYIQRRNFVYGWYGFVISIIGAHRNFMRLAKTKELYAMHKEQEKREFKKQEKNIKKAAMFGLDARIALAIFGALSVISGAALYSAIQNSKSIKVLENLREIGKAYEAYYLDTGSLLDRASKDSSSNYFYIAKTADLVNNPGYKGWSGPYLSYSVDKDSTSFPNNFLFYNESKGYNVFVLILSDDAWSSKWEDSICVSGKKCYAWSRVYLNTDIDINVAKKIDEIIDNGDGSLDGDFRWNDGGYTLKIMPVPNPN